MESGSAGDAAAGGERQTSKRHTRRKDQIPFLNGAARATVDHLREMAEHDPLFSLVPPSFDSADGSEWYSLAAAMDEGSAQSRRRTEPGGKSVSSKQGATKRTNPDQPKGSPLSSGYCAKQSAPSSTGSQDGSSSFDKAPSADGAWLKQNGKLVVINGLEVTFADGCVAPLLKLPDIYVIELEGQEYFAEHHQGKLIWNDGDVWEFQEPDGPSSTETEVQVATDANPATPQTQVPEAVSSIAPPPQIDQEDQGAGGSTKAKSKSQKPKRSAQAGSVSSSAVTEESSSVRAKFVAKKPQHSVEDSGAFVRGKGPDTPDEESSPTSSKFVAKKPVTPVEDSGAFVRWRKAHIADEESGAPQTKLEEDKPDTPVEVDWSLPIPYDIDGRVIFNSIVHLLGQDPSPDVQVLTSNGNLLTLNDLCNLEDLEDQSFSDVFPIQINVSKAPGLLTLAKPPAETIVQQPQSPSSSSSTSSSSHKTQSNAPPSSAPVAPCSTSSSSHKTQSNAPAATAKQLPRFG